MPAVLRVVLRPHMRDLTAMESIVRATKLEWTIARPPRLVPVADELYRAQSNGLPTGGTLTSVVSFRALAAFMVDSAENGFHRREIVGVCR